MIWICITKFWIIPFAWKVFCYLPHRRRSSLLINHALAKLKSKLIIATTFEPRKCYLPLLKDQLCL